MRQAVFVDTVRVPEGRRTVNADRVTALAESIKAVGLINPIQVYWDGEDAVLVAGLHRLEALRALKIEMTDAEIVKGDEIDRELIEIDENLFRLDLTELERSRCLKRRKELVEARGAALTRGGDRKSQTRKSDSLKGFAKQTAEKIGKSEQTVHRSLHRASAIVPEVQEAIADMKAADTGSELDAIASLEPDEQRQAVERVKSGADKNFREARDFIRGESADQENNRKQLTALRRAWSQASDIVRKQFWNEISAWSNAA